MSNPRYGSGRKQFIGQGIEADLSKLDPAAYPGAVAYSEGELYYSDGSDWVVPQDEVDISRPRNQPPLNATQQTQLRLSDFRSPTGESQTGIIYEINTDGLPSFVEGANILTRTITSEIANLYQILYPDDGFVPGETIWWRAKYLGTNGTQSQFSLPTAQIFPDLIATPSPVTRVNQIVSRVEVTPYESPTIFGLGYIQTETEFYSADGITLLTTTTQTAGAVTIIPTNVPAMPAGAPYAFRSRYVGRKDVASPVVSSDWSTQRVVFFGGGGIVLEYDLDAALSRTVNLPLGVYNATGMNVSVNWGDGTVETFTTGGVKSHVYAAGVGPLVSVVISGSLRQYGGDTNQQGLKRVENWGLSLGLTSLQEALRNATATLQYIAPQLPDTVTSLLRMFRSAVITNPALNLEALDVSNITSLEEAFLLCPITRPVTGWNVSKVTNFNRTFAQSTYNLPLAAWDVSSGTNFAGMFFASGGFNQPIGNWNMSSATNIQGMFNNQNAFNQNINDWDVSNVTNMGDVFSNRYTYNQPLDKWNTSKVTNMSAMFYGCAAFNQSLATWNTANVTNMSFMFYGATVFNQSLATWDTSKVTTMQNMFQTTAQFNQPLNTWNTANVLRMDFMFNNALAFNQPLAAWNTSKVTTMREMFRSANTFNQPIGSWDMSKVADTAYMFDNGRFNQEIGNWDLSSAGEMVAMFGSSTNIFNLDISNWTLKAVGPISMQQFGLAGFNIDNYCRLLTGWANKVSTRYGARTVTLGVSSRTYDTRDLSASFPGGRFANAVAARAFLIAPRSTIVSGSATSTANATYLYNATNQTYENTVSGWYFIRIGNRWELRDGSNVVQATSNALNTDEPYKETWSGGVLAGATVLIGGMAWTITGDTQV